MNLKSLSLQESKVLQISNYQEEYGLTDEQMAKRVELSAERYQEIMRDCSNISAEEVCKICANLELNFVSFMKNILHTNEMQLIFLEDLKEASNEEEQKQLAKDISVLIKNNFIIKKNDEFFQVNIAHRAYKLIPNETRGKICYLLMKYGYVNSARFISSKDNILNIKSLSDLDFMEEKSKEIFLYGLNNGISKNILTLPQYFYSIVDDLPVDEQLEVLNKAFNYLVSKLEYEQDIEDDMYKVYKENYDLIKNEIVIIKNKINTIRNEKQ